MKKVGFILLFLLPHIFASPSSNRNKRSSEELCENTLRDFENCMEPYFGLYEKHLEQQDYWKDSIRKRNFLEVLSDAECVNDEKCDTEIFGSEVEIELEYMLEDIYGDSERCITPGLLSGKDVTSCLEDEKEDNNSENKESSTTTEVTETTSTTTIEAFSSTEEQPEIDIESSSSETTQSSTVAETTESTTETPEVSSTTEADVSSSSTSEPLTDSSSTTEQSSTVSEGESTTNDDQSSTVTTATEDYDTDEDILIISSEETTTTDPSDDWEIEEPDEDSWDEEAEQETSDVDLSKDEKFEAEKKHLEVVVEKAERKKNEDEIDIPRNSSGSQMVSWTNTMILAIIVLIFAV